VSFGFNAYNKRASQAWLRRMLELRFPGQLVLEEYPFAARKSGKPMQLDIFVPSLQLAFEYQGGQHFERREIFQPQMKAVAFDEEKLEACIAGNISLLKVALL